MTGATASWANSRTVCRNASCSSLIPKSTMGTPWVRPARRREPPDQFGAQLVRFDDGVDHEFAGQPHDVDVALVLVAARLDERGPFGLVPDRRDLVGVDRVH